MIDLHAHTDRSDGTFTPVELVAEADQESESIITLLCENGGAPIGYAQLQPTPAGPHGDVELARFYIDRAYHGRGVAQSLMDAVRAQARALGGRRLWLGGWERNRRAIAFYRKCGFVHRSVQPFLLGSDLQTDWVMSRDL